MKSAPTILPPAPPEPVRSAPTLRPRLTRRGERHVLAVARWPVGGIRTHLLYNLPDLLRGGYRFTFVGPADGSLETLAAGLPSGSGCELVGVPGRGPRCRLWPTVRRLLRGGRFDLMHTHGLTASVQGALANLALGLPHLATLHDVFRPCHFSGRFAFARRRVLAWLLGRVQTLVTVTDDVRTNLLEYLPALSRLAHRMVTIPNGIDAARYLNPSSLPDCGLRQKLGLGPETTLLGFLGRFMEQKGFLVLLEALSRLASEGAPGSFHLVAVGSGDYEREYRADLQRRGLSDRVTVLPFVPDVSSLLRQLDLVVVPSLWEASSLLSMEAMAAGVPVLGSDCIGLREVLRDTPSVMVRAGDAAELAAGLRAAVREPWTEAARVFAPEACARFDNARSARRLVEVMDRLVRDVKR